jgi:lysine-specific demethylase 8
MILEQHSVTRLPVLTREAFQEARRRRLPLVAGGATADWPARKLWTPESFRDRFGSRVVQVDMPDERHQSHYGPGSPLTMAEFIDGITQTPPKRFHLVVNAIHLGGPSWYRTAQPVFPELWPEVRVPSCLGKIPLHEVNLWMGYGGVNSHLHFDPQDNFLVMLKGRKRVLLFPPDQSGLLYPAPLESRNPLQSQADPGRPEDPRFPNLARASRMELVLEEGDLLYLPAGWWHYVLTEALSIAVNFWFAPRIAAYATPPLRPLLLDRQRRYLYCLVPWLGMARLRS